MYLHSVRAQRVDGEEVGVVSVVHVVSVVSVVHVVRVVRVVSVVGAVTVVSAVSVVSVVSAVAAVSVLSVGHGDPNVKRQRVCEDLGVRFPPAAPSIREPLQPCQPAAQYQAHAPGHPGVVDPRLFEKNVSI